MEPVQHVGSWVRQARAARVGSQSASVGARLLEQILAIDLGDCSTSAGAMGSIVVVHRGAGRVGSTRRARRCGCIERSLTTRDRGVEHRGHAGHDEQLDSAAVEESKSGSSALCVTPLAREG